MRVTTILAQFDVFGFKKGRCFLFHRISPCLLRRRLKARRFALAHSDWMLNVAVRALRHHVARLPSQVSLAAFHVEVVGVDATPGAVAAAMAEVLALLGPVSSHERRERVGAWVHPENLGLSVAIRTPVLSDQTLVRRRLVDRGFHEAVGVPLRDVLLLFGRPVGRIREDARAAESRLRLLAHPV